MNDFALSANLLKVSKYLISSLIVCFDNFVYGLEWELIPESSL